MRAVTWHGRRDVRVEEVPDPVLQEPNDAIVRITSSGLCGSDLHLYETLGPFMGEGDVLGHEPMGIVEEVGPEVGDLQVGDRVVHAVPDLLRALLDVRRRAATPSARRPRSASRGWAPRCSASASCTARCPAPRRSTSGSRRRSSCRSRCPKGRPTSGSSSSPTCCPPRGSPWRTPTSPRAAPCSSWASARSATWPPGSPCTRATA